MLKDEPKAEADKPATEQGKEVLQLKTKIS